MAHSASLESEHAVAEHFSIALPALRIMYALFQATGNLIKSLICNSSLHKKHSLLNFQISKAALCTILGRHHVQAPFLDLLFGFRATDEISEKGYGLWTQPTQYKGRYSMYNMSKSMFSMLI